MSLLDFYLLPQDCAAVRAGNSIIVLGEGGTGKVDLAIALHEEMLD